MRADTDIFGKIASILVIAMAIVVVAPILSAVGCETACAMQIMSHSDCGHEMSGHDPSSGTGLLGVQAQQGLPVIAIAVAFAMLFAAPARAFARAVPVESPLDPRGVRIRI